MNLFCELMTNVAYDYRIRDDLEEREDAVDDKIRELYQGTHDEKEQLIEELNEIEGDAERRGYANGFYTALRFIADLHAEVSQEVKNKL